MIFIQNNDIEQAKHWIDYLKFDIANRTQFSKEYIILFMAAASATIFVYSVIYSVYKLDFWANVLTICLLIYILINSGVSLRMKKTTKVMPLRIIGWAFLVIAVITLGIWLFMLLVAFLSFKKYLILLFLLLPLYYLIRTFLIYLGLYVKNSFIIGWLDDLLKEILAGKVEPVEIYDKIRVIEYTSFIDAFK